MYSCMLSRGAPDIDAWRAGRAGERGSGGVGGDSVSAAVLFAHEYQRSSPAGDDELVARRTTGARCCVCIEACDAVVG